MAPTILLPVNNSDPAKITNVRAIPNETPITSFTIGDAPPTPALAHAVSVTQRVRSGRAELTIRASRAVSTTRAVVQLDLLCVAR